MFIEMKVAGIAMDSFSNTPIVILKDLEEQTALPIWIGLLEASAIATELENIRPPRPMTHDLIKSVFDTLGIKISRIEVTDLRDNTFFAAIHLLVAQEEFIIDARPSDAIALALRTHASIFVNQDVIDKSRTSESEKEGVKKEVIGEGESEKWKELLENMDPEDFGKYKM